MRLRTTWEKPHRNCSQLLLACATLVTVAVLIEISGGVAGMIVMFAGHLFLTSLVTVTMLVEIAGLVAGMIVMRSGFFLRHRFLLG